MTEPAREGHSEIVGQLLVAWFNLLGADWGQPAGRGGVQGDGATPCWRRPAWLPQLLPAVAELFGGASAELITQIGPRWSTVGAGSPQPRELSAAKKLDLVAEAVDTTVLLRRGGTLALALPGVAGEAIDPPDDQQAARPMVLLVEGPGVDDAAVAAVAEVLGTLGLLEQQLVAGANTSVRLGYLLEASFRWSLIEDTGELLGRIAEAAIDLLGAERASIFLWDRRRGKLIGRPALGVEGGGLEVDDKAGIVGAVLESGQARTWVAGDDAEAEVNRSVDRRLHFVTRSLAAVPMRSPSGQLLGVFEVLNKHSPGPGVAGFTTVDVAALTDLARHAAAAIHAAQARQRLTRTRDRLLHDAASTYQVIGHSPAIHSLRETIARVAPTELAVLCLGENGTGKEVVARSLHFQSPRRDEPFVAVNCAALVESLLESELFGHERGAFTDAHQSRPGQFEQASGGSLFLDEIGDMSLGGQAKLLRVLEEKTVVRVGGSVPIPVDVRIIAATNQSLPELVAAKRFREDLYFRLNVVAFRLPPLRERGDDILLLAEHFLAHFADQTGRGAMELNDSARRALLRHRWPGNVRELRNVMERAAYLAHSTVIRDADLGLGIDEPSPLAADHNGVAADAPGSLVSLGQGTLADVTRQLQIAHIEAAIERHQGNMTAAAASLGLHRSNLYRKMRQLGMDAS